MGRLILDYSMPAIVGTLVSALYSIVDRIYIGHALGATALSGLGVTFPILSLTMAMGVLVGVGASSRISIYLGENNREKAEQVLGNSLILTILLNIIFIPLLLIFLKPLLMKFGASEETYPYAAEYLKIVLPGNIFVTMCYSFNSMMRSSGYPKKAMYTMLIGAVFNILLNPFFIYVCKMGIAGVSWATVISMFFGMVFVMIHFFGEGRVIRLRIKDIRFDKKIVFAILSIGLSPFLMQVAASGVSAILNTSLLKYGGDLAIGAFGIVNSISLVFVMLIVGLNQGLQPIMGYNYGAQNYARVKEALFAGIKIATLMSCVAFVVAVFFPDIFAGIFTSDPVLLEVSRNALRYSVIGFPVIGFQIVVGGLFQSIAQIKKSIIQSVGRQIVFLVPAIIILPRFFGLNGVWLSMPVSDFLGAALTLFFLYYQVKQINILEYKKNNSSM